MRGVFGFCAFVSAVMSTAVAQTPAPSPASTELLHVKRIYVAQLTGGPSADQFRDLIIAGIDSTGLFVLTENPDRADAVLKGAADDHAFVDVFDSSGGISARENAGSIGNSSSSRSNRSLPGIGISDNESHHTNQRKHEAYAAVRLCSKDGDVLWSTTQESLGAKFKSASADVAAKIARQLTLDVGHARQQVQASGPSTPQ